MARRRRTPRAGPGTGRPGCRRGRGRVAGPPGLRPGPASGRADTRPPSRGRRGLPAASVALLFRGRRLRRRRPGVSRDAARRRTQPTRSSRPRRGRSARVPSSAAIVTPSRSNSSGGIRAGGGRGEDGRSRRLAGTYPGRRPAPNGVLGSPVQRFSTPRGREAGEIPAQSRYGERPARGASPVADPRCMLEPSRER